MQYSPKPISETTFELKEYTPTTIDNTSFEVGVPPQAITNTLGLNSYSDLTTLFKTTSINSSLSLLSTTNSNISIKQKEVNRDIRLPVNSIVKTTQKGVKANSTFYLDSNSEIHTSIYQSKPNRLLTLSSFTEIVRKGFNYNISTDSVRSFKATTQLSNLKGLTESNKLRACIEDLRSNKATIDLKDTKSSTTFSSKKATIEDIRKHSREYLTASRSSTIHLLNPQIVTDGSTNKLINILISLESDSILSSLENQLVVQKTLKLNSQTFTFSAQSGFTIGANLSIEPISTIDSIKNFNSNEILTLQPSTNIGQISPIITTRSINLVPFSEVLNLQDIAVVEELLSLAPSSTLTTDVQGNKLTESLFLGNSSVITTISTFEQITNTLTLNSISEILTTTDTSTINVNISLSSISDEISTLFTSTSNTISLVQETLVTTLKQDTVAETVSLINYSEVLNAQSVKSIQRTVELSNSNTLSKVFSTKDVENFIILSQQSQLETITQFINIAEQVSLTPETVEKVITTLRKIAESINLISESIISTKTDVTKVEEIVSLSSTTVMKTDTIGTKIDNPLSFVSTTVVSAVESIESSTTINLTPTVSNVVIDTFYAQPNEDVSINYNEWFRSDQDQTENFHYTMLRGINPNDSNYIQSVSTPTNVTAIFGLDSSSGPYVNNGQLHQLKVRSRGNGSLGSVNLEVKLYSGATLITTATYNNRPSSFGTTTLNLTSAQVNQLNYNNIQIEVTANTTDGSNKRMEISWVQLIIPEVEQ